MKSFLILKRLPLLLLLAAAEAPALNIASGDVVVRRLGTYGFTHHRSELSFDGRATDQLHQMYGYLGNANGVVPVTKANFDALSGISAAGNTATSSIVLDANGAGALGLAAGDVEIDYLFTLINDSSAADRDGFSWGIEVRNQSGASLDLVFYSYLDLNLDGAADYADDRALADLTRILVSDSSSGTRYEWRASAGGSATHFEVQQYPLVQNLLDGMGSATDLSDSVASFGPGDFSGAFQYDFRLAVGESFKLVTSVPEPSTALMTALGLLGLSLLGSRVRS
jgi:hypothetical protein